MKGFTDIHHHLIHGIDADGPRTFEDTCAMLRAARADGIRAIIATPHVMPGVYPFPAEAYCRNLHEARAYCRREEIDITIYPGAEIFYTEMTLRHLQDGRIPTMAGTSYVLVEFSTDVRYPYLLDALQNLSRSGYIPILAHPERYQCLVSHPRSAGHLKSQTGVRYQLNCSSIIKKKGFFLNRFCRVLLSEGLVDAVATDAHNVHRRPVAMKGAFARLLEHYGRGYAESLTGRGSDQVLHDVLDEGRGAV